VENINIEKVLRTNPFLALDISNIEEIALKYLPYSIGIEIECDRNDNYNIENFKNIPDIVEVLSTNGEERFRIPNGIKGLCCLYNISEQLKNNCSYSSSGIHYHVDFSDMTPKEEIYFDLVTANAEFLHSNKDF
jgi:hypothetical protein